MKQVLITGGATGIGAATAQVFLERGYRVFVTVHQTAAELPGVTPIPCDIMDPADVERLFAAVGTVDVLVNNAGIQRRHPFTEFPEQEWNDVIAVNQTAVFLVSQAVTRHMVERKAGKVINICSMQSELGRDTITPYAASKGAVKMLTRGMCVELARHNIQVNGIAPGYFKTEMTKALVEDEAFTAWLCKRTPAARWGDPQELIGAAVFLSSKASDFVNGHLLFVDGGMLVAV